MEKLRCVLKFAWAKEKMPNLYVRNLCYQQASAGNPGKNVCNSIGGGLEKDEKQHSANTISLAAETRKSAEDQNIQTTVHETVDKSQQVSAKSTSMNHTMQEKSCEVVFFIFLCHLLSSRQNPLIPSSLE